MAINIKFPSGWAQMTSKQVGSDTRDTREPGGSYLQLVLDDQTLGFGTQYASQSAATQRYIYTFNCIDIQLPSLQAQAYSTALLSQYKWLTSQVSRLVDADQISSTIECSAEEYAQLASAIGEAGTARITIPNQHVAIQFRVSILNVDGPSLVDGDRMTATLVLTVTNTAPDGVSEMGPVIDRTNIKRLDSVAGPTLNSTASWISAGDSGIDGPIG